VYESVSVEKTHDLFPITAGTTIDVTPHIIRIEGEPTQVQLILNIKDGTVIPKSGTDKSNTKDSTIVTQAIVAEGQSVLVGGYFREHQEVHDSGVPFLKNIPLLGAMFREKGRNKTISERLFMITPTILHLSANDSEANKVYFKPTRNGESILEEPSLKDIHVDKTP
jgi:type III secretion protein C